MTAHTSDRPRLGVGMVGYAFMGVAHSQAWRNAPRFFDLPLGVDMAAVAGRDETKVRAAAARLGWRDVETDWKALVGRDDVDLVDVCTPGDTHADIAIAALGAGKHVLCEKPLANSVAEAEAMAAAAAATPGLVAMVGFTYRRVPATAFARDLVARGRIGTVQQVRASYRQDWLVDPQAPLAWRLRKELAGSGALGDIGAHAVDLAPFITGDLVTSVSGVIDTIISERPLPADATPGEVATLGGVAGAGTGTVTVDDVAMFTGRFASGVLGSFEASRFATGRKNALRVEVSGSEGAIAFDLEDLNSLQIYDRAADASEQGFTRVLVTEPQHPYVKAWWPAGHMLGYEHGFSHQVVDFVSAVASGTQPSPSFADGLQVQRVLDAVERSSQNASVWTGVA